MFGDGFAFWLGALAAKGLVWLIAVAVVITVLVNLPRILGWLTRLERWRNRNADRT